MLNHLLAQPGRWGLPPLAAGSSGQSVSPKVLALPPNPALLWNSASQREVWTELEEVGLGVDALPCLGMPGKAQARTCKQKGLQLAALAVSSGQEQPPRKDGWGQPTGAEAEEGDPERLREFSERPDYSRPLGRLTRELLELPQLEPQSLLNLMNRGRAFTKHT